MKPRLISASRFSLLGSAIAALLAASAPALHAQATRTWNNNGTTSVAWLTAGNWSGSTNFAGEAPLANPTGEGVNTDIMGFVTANTGTTAGINMNTLAAAGGVGLSLGGIDFTRTSTAAFQIGNSSSTVSGILQLNGATINSVANTLIRANSGNMTITNVATGATNGGQTLGLRLGITNGIFDVATTRTLTISSLISEAAANSGFTKTGAGIFILSNANTYSGVTNVNVGTLQIQNNAALGTTGGNTIVASGASVQLTAPHTALAEAFNITGTGAGGIGALRIGGGSTTTISGAVTLGGNASILTDGGVTVNLTGGIVTAGNTITLSSNATAFNVNTVGISGTGGVIKDTGSPVTFSAVNSYEGTTSISAGTLSLTGSLTGGGAISTSSTGILSQSAAGVISGASTFTQGSTGASTLAGANSYSGTTAINLGTVNISNNTALGNTTGNTTIVAAGNTTAGGILALSGNINSGENISITGNTEQNSFNAVINNTSGTNTLSGNILLNSPAGNIRIGAASGTLNLTGNISQTGTSRVLVFQPAGATSSIVVNNAIANNGGQVTIYGFTAGGAVTLSGVSGSGIGNTLVAQNGLLRLGVTDALNTTGSLTLGEPAANDIGSIDLAGFNQTVNGLNGTLGSNPNNTRRVVNTVAGTRILTVGNGGGNGTFNGQINTGTGNIQLIKTGVGNQTLNDVNSYTGGTRIDGGTLTLGHGTNTLADGGAVNVNGGTLALGTNTDTVGAVTLTSGSITGSGAGTLTGTGSAYDVRSGAISAKLGGTVGLNKTTGGTVTISSDNSSGGYTGATAVNGGTLLINGNISTSITTVASTATLGGTGTVGALTVQSGGSVTPGNSPGILTVNGNYIQAGQYTAEIAGTTAGNLATNHDQINVSGTVNITGGSLVTAFSAGTYALNNLIFLLLNDNTEAITGTYATFAQGDVVATFGGFDWKISYIANGNNTGSPSFTGGNDIALMAVPEPNVAALIGALGGILLLRRRR